jgi:hypothetical protein
MELRQARPGAAVELPQGIYTLDRVTHCRATAIEWLIFELAADDSATPAAPLPLEGRSGQDVRMAISRPAVPAVPTLALMADRLYAVTVAAADALPSNAELTFEDVPYHLRHRGEARGERAGRTGHADFWLGPYRHYEATDRVLLFMDVHGQVQRLSGNEMDPQLVRLY